MSKGGRFMEISFAVLLVPVIVALFLLPARFYGLFLAYGMLGISVLMGVLVGLGAGKDGRGDANILWETIKALAGLVIVLPLVLVGFFLALMASAWIFGKLAVVEAEIAAVEMLRGGENTFGWFILCFSACTVLAIAIAIVRMVRAARPPHGGGHEPKLNEVKEASGATSQQ